MAVQDIYSEQMQDNVQIDLQPGTKIRLSFILETSIVYNIRLGACQTKVGCKMEEQFAHSSNVCVRKTKSK